MGGAITRQISLVGRRAEATGALRWTNGRPRHDPYPTPGTRCLHRVKGIFPIMNDTDQAVDYIELAADIVSAYVSNNPVPPGELGQLTARIHAALVQIATGQSEAEAKAAAAPQQPAVPVKKSVTADHIVCLEDGRTFKSLKRH